MVETPLQPRREAQNPTFKGYEHAKTPHQVTKSPSQYLTKTPHQTVKTLSQYSGKTPHQVTKSPSQYLTKTPHQTVISHSQYIGKTPHQTVISHSQYLSKTPYQTATSLSHHSSKTPHQTARTISQYLGKTPHQTPKTQSQFFGKTPAQQTVQFQSKVPLSVGQKAPLITSRIGTALKKKPKVDSIDPVQSCVTPFNTKDKLNNNNNIKHYDDENQNPVIYRTKTVNKTNEEIVQHTKVNNEEKHRQPVGPPRTPAVAQYQTVVKGKTYKIVRKIGTGGSAKVYEAFDPLTKHKYAIKIINIAQADQQTRESYFREVGILEKLKFLENVVTMYDHEYKRECQELVIVMELGTGDLSQELDHLVKGKKGNRDKMIDGFFIQYYWRGMVQAVNDIHQRGIIHSDLKPVNFILVDSQNDGPCQRCFRKIKLIDFGIASDVEPEQGTSIIRDFKIGTINYMAPEALRNRAGDISFRLDGDCDFNPKTVIKYNSKVDIWSLGCILYSLVYGRPPFDKFNETPAKIQAITNPNYTIDFPPIPNRNLLNLLKSCLRYHPDDRPTAKELLEFLKRESWSF